ncbi:hypothetical protein ABZ434_28860 [Streptomyces sp. NPDC005761]|uniref:SCO2584 family spore wall biosynthesis protein n=1 Tax=Streptomyces sp. NPDC005761 TaxID=3157066 RepID=UPI0033E9FD93
MPDDVGGRPFPNGWEPDDDRGGADEDFASVVFDEDFVQAAEFHEPTAVERLLAAAEARAETDAFRARAGGGPLDDDLHDDGYGRGSGYDGPWDADDDYGVGGPYGRHGGALRPYRGAARWHRPVAWLLALLMGIGMVALAFSAVFRNTSGDRQDQVPPPATSGVDSAPGPTAAPSAADGYSRPMVSAVPHTP